MSSLTDHLSPTPHLLTECEGCVVVEPLQFIPVPEGRTQDGAEGRSLSPALGAHNFQTNLHEDASA